MHNVQTCFTLCGTPYTFTHLSIIEFLDNLGCLLLDVTYHKELCFSISIKELISYNLCNCYCGSASGNLKSKFTVKFWLG